MININLKSIKRESINSIFSVISLGENTSRANISQKTGLSLMTVGKVVDALLEKNIIMQTKQIKSEVGRKAGLVNLNPDNKLAILDFSSYDFSIDIFNVSLKKSKEYSYKYNFEKSFEDNFYVFLDKANDFISVNISKNNLIGIGCSMPGPYYENTDRIINKRIPELNKILISAEIEKKLGTAPILVCENVKLGAMVHIRNTESYRSKVILYIHIGEGVSGAVAIEGELIQGLGSITGEMGQMTVDNLTGECVEDYMNSSDISKENKENLLLRLIHNLIWILGPHVVIIEADDEKFEITKEKLVDFFKFKEREFPEIVSTVSDIKNSHIGAGIIIRDMWLENKLT